MDLVCGPQSIVCINCKKEFGGDIFLDADLDGYDTINVSLVLSTL